VVFAGNASSRSRSNRLIPAYSTNTPDWFSDLVKEIVSRYEYTFEVVPSKLDERPFF